MEYNFNELVSKVKNNEYRLLGSGSSRMVYDLNNGYVLKLAIDVRGISQNKAENRVYQSHKSSFFAEILAISEDDKFIIMAKAREIKNISTVYNYYKVQNIKTLVLRDKLYQDIRNHKLSMGDLRRASSWGFINDVPVIIDYGLTQGILNKYYRNRLFRKKFKKLVL